MVFSDDIVLAENNRVKVNQILDEWRLALKKKGLKINRSKTEYIGYGGILQVIDMTSRVTTISGNTVGKVKGFKYLGFFVQKSVIFMGI